MESATVSSLPTDATNAERVRWSFAQLNKRDVTPLKQFWTAETVERFPDRTCHGTDEIGDYFEAILAAIPDFHIEMLSVAEQGDDVFVQWRITGSHGGTLQGIEATGKRLEIDGIDHFVIRDGRVVSNFVVFDQMQFARSIGMMPPDGSTPDRALKATFNAKTKLAARLKR